MANFNNLLKIDFEKKNILLDYLYIKKKLVLYFN